MQNLNFKLFLALLAILPLIFWTKNAESPYDLIRFLSITVTAFVMLFVYWSKELRNDKIEIRYNTPLLLLTGTLVATVVSYFLSINPFLSMWGNKLLPSDSLWSVISVFLITFFSFQAIRNAQDIKTISTPLLFVLAVQIAFGYAQVYGIDPFWWATSEMIYGTFGLTIAFATVVGCIIPFAIYQFMQAEKKYLQVLLWLLIFFAANIILHSGSRTPNFANYLSASAIIIYYLFKKTDRSTKLKALGVLCAFISALVWFSIDPHNKEFKNKIDKNYFSHSANIRVELTKTAFDIFQEKPLFGHGPETFAITQALKQSPELNRSFWKDAWVKAHNNVAHNLACLGLFGTFFLLASFVYVVIKNLQLLFQKNVSLDNSFAYAMGCSYCMIFVANLTCFNISYTQIIYYILPVFMGKVLNPTDKVFRLDLRKSVKTTLAIASISALLFLTVKAYQHWYTDTLYQEARRVKIVESNWPQSVELLDRAIFINEQEPYFHCFRSNNLAEMLIHNKARLGPSDVQKTIEIIDISVQNCIKLSINREHPISMAAYTYLILYDKKLFFDRKKVLETLKLAHTLAPQNPDILLKMAAVYFDAGDMDNYLLHANKSIEMKIDYIPAYMDLISYYYNEKNLEAAQALIQRVLKIQFISAEFIPALKLLAEVSLKNNDKDSAQAVLKFYDENFYITQL